MPGLLIAEMPAGVAQVARAIAEFNHVEMRDLFVADADHEELREGAYSIACEAGSEEWTYEITEHLRKTGNYPKGWFVEARNHWCVALYPERD